MKIKKAVFISMAMFMFIFGQMCTISTENSGSGNTGKKSGPDNTLTKQQKKSGWQMLFDGKTLDGWSVKSGYANYKVEDGSIVGITAEGSPNTFLCSDEKFADFELTFEVKFDEEFFNSGVQIRSKLRGEEYGGRVYGPQIEIEESPGQSGYIYGEAAGGWQSPEPQSKDESINSHSHFKNDTWNQYRVLATGRRIQTWINGHKIADLVYDVDRYLENSEGFIGLQVHSVPNFEKPITVRWKNIYIRPLENDEQISDVQEYAPLFNGENFDGWNFHLGEEGADNDGTFTIKENETIHCSGKPAGYIYTEKSYSNFNLKYEWAFERPEDLQADSLFRGNSGCLLHIGEKNVLGVWPLSIEVQGMNRQAGMIIPIPRTVKCDRTYFEKSKDKAINPVGEWNKMEIDVNGDQMLVKLNSVIVSIVKNSELTEGPIGFQSEGAPIRWKNIRIVER